MINANELRIGITINYFNRPVTINNYSELLNCFSSNGIIEIGCEPILLTEEILLNHGFVLKRGYYTKKHYGHIKILLHEDGVAIYVLGLRIDHITNLHQLQNLYFSLTGQEL